VVNSATPEFDYPKGADNVFSFYKGEGGIPISGFVRRALFSYYFRDINLLVTENIVAQSKIMMRRNILGRLQYLAPFLRLDSDPYIALLNGRLVWIVDAYTTSDHYPYSQDIDGLNYVRNSVKAVIDAYDGTTTLYVADAEDPVIQTWQNIFPAMFKPLSAMSNDLRSHIRYPEDFFQLQASIYRTYHMKDPQVFYNREDQWDVAKENYAGTTGSAKVNSWSLEATTQAAAAGIQASTFRIGFPTQVLSGTYTVQLASNIQDDQGNALDENENAVHR